MKIPNNPRNILNKIKWSKEYSLSEIEIYYVHRGAADNTMIICGEDIVDLDRSFMQTKNGSIPYHRIFKIVYKKNIIFKR